MDRKAQSMSINVIVIAALALLVLVVLSFVFLNQARRTSAETSSCINNGGTCTDLPAGAASSADACTSSRVLNYKCEAEEQGCCLNV